MNSISLIDLDDSVFQSRGKCPAGTALTMATVDRQGQPLAFCTPKQVKFLQFLSSGGLVVPVTAREIDGFKRVQIPFAGHAITSFGAVILTPEREIEPRWHEIITKKSSDASDAVHECLRFLTEAASSAAVDAHVYIISDAGLPLYVNAKHNGHDIAALAVLAAALKEWLPEGWKMHFNGNNLAALPPYLGKDNATTFYLQELAPEHSFVIGLGDSFTDLCFMGLCDYALTPTGSQIFQLLNDLTKSGVPDSV